MINSYKLFTDVAYTFGVRTISMRIESYISKIY